MNEAEIKRKRTESILKELIPEAIASLNDTRLHELSVIEVKCSKGRDDAKVFLDPSYFNEKEKNLLLKQLKKARAVIEDYCLKEQGWYKTPKLSFEFDTHYQRVNKIEELFKKIESERKSGA